MAGLFSAALFLMFAKMFPNSSLGQWANAHLVLVYGVGLFCICFLPTRHIIAATDRHILSRSMHKNLRKQLGSLGSDDKLVLQYPITNRQMAFRVGHLHHHIAKSLEKRGIVHEVEVQGFMIDRNAFDCLVEHPELIGVKKAS